MFYCRKYIAAFKFIIYMVSELIDDGTSKKVTAITLIGIMKLRKTTSRASSSLFFVVGSREREVLFGSNQTKCTLDNSWRVRLSGNQNV